MEDGDEGATGGNDLIQYFGAVGVLGYQSFESVNLAANFSEARDESVFFVLRVNMSHGVYLLQNRRGCQARNHC